MTDLRKIYDTLRYQQDTPWHEESRGLKEDRSDIKLVPDAHRKLWLPKPGSRARCFHEDGRGRCRRRDTKGFLVDGFVMYYCPKHEGDASA